jgi:hypothetical protein
MAALLLFVVCVLVSLLIFTAFAKSKENKRKESLSKTLTIYETAILDEIYKRCKQTRFDGINRFDFYDYLLKTSLDNKETPESPGVIFMILDDLMKHKFIKQVGYSIFMTEFGRTFYEQYILPRK